MVPKEKRHASPNPQLQDPGFVGVGSGNSCVPSDASHLLLPWGLHVSQHRETALLHSSVPLCSHWIMKWTELFQASRGSTISTAPHTHHPPASKLLNVQTSSASFLVSTPSSLCGASWQETSSSYWSLNPSPLSYCEPVYTAVLVSLWLKWLHLYPQPTLPTWPSTLTLTDPASRYC